MSFPCLSLQPIFFFCVLFHSALVSSCDTIIHNSGATIKYKVHFHTNVLFLYSKCYAKCFFRLLLGRPFLLVSLRLSRNLRNLCDSRGRALHCWWWTRVWHWSERRNELWTFLMCGARILDESNSMSNTMLSEDSIVATAAKCEHLINENRDWTFPLFLLSSLNFFEHTSRPNRTRCDQRQDWPAGFSLEMKVRLVINSWNKKRFENPLVFVKIWEIFLFTFQCSFFGCERLVAVVADQRTIFHIF